MFYSLYKNFFSSTLKRHKIRTTQKEFRFFSLLAEIFVRCCFYSTSQHEEENNPLDILLNLLFKVILCFLFSGRTGSVQSNQLTRHQNNRKRIFSNCISFFSEGNKLESRPLKKCHTPTYSNTLSLEIQVCS